MVGKVNCITIDSDSDSNSASASDEVEEIEEVKLNAYEPVITDVTVFDDIKINLLFQRQITGYYNWSWRTNTIQRWHQWH